MMTRTNQEKRSRASQPTVDTMLDQLRKSPAAPKQASVISEVTYEKLGTKTQLKLKLHDKLNALVNLGKKDSYESV